MASERPVTTHAPSSPIEHTCLNDTSATTALPGQEDGQEYECCECLMYRVYKMMQNGP